MNLKITHNKKAQQASLLYISTIVGVIIGMGVSVLNTRALPPTEYGDVRYVNNIISFFAGLLLVGYFVSGGRLLAIAKSRQEAAQIKGGIIFILTVVAIILVILTTICGLIHQFILHKDYAYLFYSALPVCISPLLLNFINTTSQGDNSIGMIALARVLPSLFYVVIAWFIYNYWGATPQRMLWLHNGIAMLILGILIWINKPSFKNLRNSLRCLNNENKNYGLHVYYGSIVAVSIPYIAGVTLGFFATNNANVAFYTLALTITAPLAMAPSVIGTTFFKQFANQSRISTKVIQLTVGTSIISIVGFVIIIFPLVNFLYDASYQSVAVYACFLAVASTAQGLGDVFNRFLGAHGQGRQLRNGAWLSGAIAIIGYTIGIYFFDIYGAIITRILSMIVYCVAMILYYISFTKRVL